MVAAGYSSSERLEWPLAIMLAVLRTYVQTEGHENPPHTNQFCGLHPALPNQTQKRSHIGRKKHDPKQRGRSSAANRTHHSTRWRSRRVEMIPPNERHSRVAVAPTRLMQEKHTEKGVCVDCCVQRSSNYTQIPEKSCSAFLPTLLRTEIPPPLETTDGKWTPLIRREAFPDKQRSRLGGHMHNRKLQQVHCCRISLSPAPASASSKHPREMHTYTLATYPR